TLYATSGPLRLPPVSSRHITPPLPIGFQARGAFRTDKDHGSRNQRLVGWARHTGGKLYSDGVPVGLAFRRGHIAGRTHEFGKLIVGDMGEIHPEALQLYLMSGFFIGLGQLAVAAHQEDPGGYPRHPGGGVDSVTNNNDWSTFRFCLRRPKPDRSKAETHP